MIFFYLIELKNVVNLKGKCLFEDKELFFGEVFVDDVCFSDWEKCGFD